MAVTWADSADRHGIDHEDALHAVFVFHVMVARPKMLERMNEEQR